MNPRKLFKRKHDTNSDLTIGNNLIYETAPLSPQSEAAYKQWLPTSPATPQMHEDPTYGFAQFVENKSYLRTASIDSNLSAGSTNEFQDILYPLRSSFGSHKSDNEQQPPQRPHQHDQLPKEKIFLSIDDVSRKRVKFNDARNIVRSHNYFDQPYQFTAANGQQNNNGNVFVSLKHRLSNFFSNLF